MSILTGHALSSGESALDARLCAGVGAELARVRATRGLTVTQVGEKLLLSTRQVKALEQVEFAAFHNATFYVNALKKYAAFAGVDPALVANIASAIARPNPVGAAQPEPDPVAGVDDGSRRGLMVVLSVLLVVAAVGAGGYLLWARNAAAPASGAVASPAALAAPAPPPPASPEPAREPAVVQAADADLAPGDTIVAKTPAAFGALRVLHPSWIFVRDSENAVIERTLTEGEWFELETQPTYLAIGTTDAELTIGSSRVDLSRFVASGQIRIRAGDFDALVQGASPIPAPTAAAVR